MTEEQKIAIIQLRTQGIKYQDIADQLGLTLSAVASRISRYQRDLIKKNPWTDEETEKLIELRDQGISYSIIAGELNKRIESVKKKCSNLLKEGRIQSIRGARGGNMSASSRTTLYLIKFEDFYKVGITQQKLKDRFSGAPGYIVIDTVSTTLDNAWELEKAIKESVQSMRYVPEHTWFIRNGRTECFKTDKPIKALEDLL
jgi:predicted transcriptional regulator